MYADDMAVELENERVTARVIEELLNLSRDNLSLSKKKTKSIVTSDKIKTVLNENGKETVSQQKYLGVTLANTNAVMRLEAKKTCEHFTTSMAKKLARITCSLKQRSLIYQCIVVAYTSYHFVPFIVVQVIELDAAVNFTLHLQKKVATGQSSTSALEFAMLLTPE